MMMKTFSFLPLVLSSLFLTGLGSFSPNFSPKAMGQTLPTQLAQEQGQNNPTTEENNEEENEEENKEENNENTPLSPNELPSDLGPFRDIFMESCQSSAEEGDTELDAVAIEKYCSCTFDQIAEKYTPMELIAVFQNETMEEELQTIVEYCAKELFPESQ